MKTQYSIHVALLSLLLCMTAPGAPAQDENRAVLHRKLVAEIERLAAQLDGVMGFAIKDLSSNEEILHNSEFLFPTGSAIKVPVLLELHKQAAEGRYKLTDQLRVERKNEVSSPVLQYFNDGTSSLSLHDLAVLMIRHSDNIATNMLIDQVGMENVNRTLDQLGLKQMRLRRKMINPAASARGDENTSTPREAERLMELIYRGQVVDRELCDRALTILKLPKSTPISTSLPRGVQVAHKTGSIEGVQCEWAIVYVPNRPYVITVMTNYIGEGAREAITQISRLVYEYFARIARSTPYGARVPVELLKQKP